MYIEYKKSWVAYVKAVIPPLFITLILYSIFKSITNNSFFINFIIVFSGLAYTIYRFLLVKSYKIYTDDDGAWVFKGIFPWNKGANGIKWRDIEGAAYYTGFFSWAFKSYNIKISNRFTQGTDIYLTDIDKGNNAVQEINKFHIDLIKNPEI